MDNPCAGTVGFGGTVNLLDLYDFLLYLCLAGPGTSTVSSRFLAHTPLSEHAPLLEYRRMEVNRNIYNIGAPAFSVNSQNPAFRL